MSRIDRVFYEQEKLEKKSQKRQDLSSDTVRKYQKKANMKGLIIFLVIFVCIVEAVYLPGAFIKDKSSAISNTVVLDSSAISTAQKALNSSSSSDFDDDGLTNAEEMRSGTNPYDMDTDHDGISDKYEIQTLKTDPLSYDKNLLVSFQKKEDKKSKTTTQAPYTIGNVVLWAKNERSKAFGSVVRTQSGYRFSDFWGYAQFPEEDGKYVYLLNNGIHTPLKYNKKLKVWAINGPCTVEIYEKPLTKVAEFSFFSHKFYSRSNIFSRFFAAILPSKGWITGVMKTQPDIEPETEDDITSEISNISYSVDSVRRFQKNTNTLTDLQYVYQTIKKGRGCVAVSLFKKEEGEYVGIIYGYDPQGNLLIADASSLKTIGTLSIEETSKKIVDANGNIGVFEYFDFSGLGFDSKAGDRICFFSSNSTNALSNLTNNEKPSEINEEEMKTTFMNPSDETETVSENSISSSTANSGRNEMEKEVASMQK